MTPPTGGHSAGPSTPGDVTVGELWRTVDSLRGDVTALPLRIAAELDSRMLERLSALRTEMDARDEVVAGRLQSQIDRLTERLAPLQRAVFAAVGTVCLGMIAALLELVLHHSTP